ncbi:MAG: VCBS repeat-containing protein [Deltaproteobacteria bacterium]|nr:VCBS repeat-containing protein [Deltaproteobacteria bacterium]
MVAVVLASALPTQAASMFGERRAYPVGTSPVGVVAAELDGKSGVDVATADEGGSVSFLANRGDGVFSSAGQIALDSRYTATALTRGSFNGDAIGDLAVAANDSESQTFVGTLLIFRSLAVAQYAATPVALGLFPTCVVNDDVTGDGLADLIACSTNPLGGGLVSILRRRADFSYTPPVSVPLPGVVPRRLTTGDVDGDGHVDLVVVDTDNDSVWILYGLSEPNFEAPVRLAVVNKPSAVRVATFTAASRSAVVVASAAQNEVLVFHQTQARSFQDGIPQQVGQEPSDLAIADVDSDGDMDVLVSNASSNTVSVLLSDAQAGLSLAQTVAVGKRPVAIVTADFNGDGMPDFATADQNDVGFGADVQSVSVVLNGVSPPFTATPTTTSSSTPTPTKTPSLTPSGRSTPTVTGTRRTATSTPRPSPTPAGPLDANCDGRLDASDIDTLVARIFDGQSGCLTRRVTAADVAALVKALEAAR